MKLSQHGSVNAHPETHEAAGTRLNGEWHASGRARLAMRQGESRELTATTLVNGRGVS